jgi:hypothetical protein
VRRVAPLSLWALWALAAVLCLAPGLWAPREGAARESTPRARLLAPFTELAARVQWIRFQRAVLAGRPELAIARAESALALEPRSTAGWDLLASYLGFDLASPEREPDPERRLGWVRAALAVARRGEVSATEPGRLALLRGLVLQTHAELDPELPWPDGARALWTDAAAAFEEASALGVDAAALTAHARERGR